MDPIPSDWGSQHYRLPLGPDPAIAQSHKPLLRKAPKSSIPRIFLHLVAVIFAREVEDKDLSMSKWNVFLVCICIKYTLVFLPLIARKLLTTSILTVTSALLLRSPP